MPGKVGVKIKAGRNLPVMDRGSDTTDAYVEIKLGSVTHKTDVCRKSLNPQWNTDWFRFEVDDAELQDEPLQIRLMDHDTYSANDAIGKVNISLNPLCLENASHLGQGKGAVMSGWIPVFDTMHGIRGEVNIIVKVDLFSDANKFRQSSCGVQFFHSCCIPHGYRAQVIHGFVEELVVNDDPEYQWIDKIRTPRASNEARQVVFLKLSGQVQRKIGLKAINLGANAVIGYTQCFDLEGDVGVVARGIGTAVTLVKIQEPFSQLTLDTALIEERTLRYLEFLKGSGSGDESSRSKFDYDNLQNSCRSRVYTMLGIDPVERTTAKSPNVILKKKWRPARESNTIVEESLSENDGIKQLLYQEDMRGEKPQKFRHVKKLTKSSRNMLNEKFNAFKLKMYEERTEGNVSVNSSYSDISFTEPLRSSITDLRGLMRLRKSRMNRSISDGNGMAAVLVNSLIHGPNLDLISEARDSERSTPNRSIKSNKSKKSESMGNLSRTNTEEQLGSSRVSSDVSTSTPTISSSTTEEAFSDDEDDEATTTSCAGITEPDTISMVVKTVLAREHSQDENWIEPGTTQEDESPVGSKVEVRVVLPKQFSTDAEGDGKILTGATRIVKHRKYSKVTECEIIETEPTAQNLEDILKTATTDEDSVNWIEPGSTTDEPETIDKERRGSLLHDVVENISGKFHHLQEHMHLPHFADEQSNQSKQVSPKTLNTQKNLEVNRKPTNIQKLSKNMKGNNGNLSALSKKILSHFHSKPKKSEEDLTKGENGIAEELRDLLHASPEKWFKGKGHMETMQNSPFSRGTFTIPEICLTNMQLQTTHLDAGEDNFYSSAPECRETTETIPPSPLRVSFLSLTNLKINDADDSNIPSSPAPSTSDFIPDPVDYVQSQTQLYKHSPKSQKCLDSARSNFLSSSFTNLSTNKAPTLAPFPHLKHFRSELGTNSVNAGVCIAATVAVNKVVGHTRAESMGCKISQSPAKVGNSAPICTVSAKDKDKDSGICRRSSDSDLSVTPKGNSICVASDRLVNATNMMRLTATLKPPIQENLDMMEYPFLTMAKYPPGFILHIGATVTARSVKLLERVPNPDEPETRDSWWTELRMEIRSHARSLGCNVILGYSEVTTISDDVCVLSATGTAAIINMSYNLEASQIELTTSSKKDLMVSSLDEKNGLGDAKPLPKDITDGLSTKEYSSSLGGTGKMSFPPITFPLNLSCSLCHIPYTKSSVPYNVKMKRCGLCKRGKVPDVLLATIEIPECLQISGRGCFLQAQIVRAKKDLRSESNAKEISDGLPFMEYELHRLLINKLKAKGMNAIFGLKAQVAVGEKMMALIATGTAVFLSALPPPIVPKIVAGNSWTDTEKLNNLQKSLQETFERNREIYQLKPFEIDPQSGKQSDTDDSDDEVGELDLNTGNKDTCVLEIDDIEDLEIISLLMESCPPEGFHVVNTQSVPGLEDMEVVKNLQMFTQVWRAKISVGQTLGQFPKHFQRLLQTIFFKLRSMIPCAICDLKFRLDLPESDEIQLLVTGMALGLGEVSKLSKLRRKQLPINLTDGVLAVNDHSETNGKKPQEDELIFSLDEDQLNIEASLNQTPPNNTNFGSHSFKLRKTSPQRTKFNSVKLSRHTPLKERYGVDITPLSYVPGGKIEKYLGNLNFFFIRESTSIRENGGISGFVHSFITELLAVVRAHISALGGNAMVSFYMTELILVDNQHKNQGQCLISIGGDVVYVSYFTDD